MKATFISKEPQEIKILAKADDMAGFIWELKHNAWREFKETDYDYERAWEVINKLLDRFKIDIDDLNC